MSMSGGQDTFVRLVRDSLHSPWGFRLTGGAEYNTPLVVGKVYRDHAADGALVEGDVIKRIGFDDATRLTHQAAIDIITRAGSSLDFLVGRRTFGKSGPSSSGTQSGGGPQISRYKPSDPQDAKIIPQNKNLAELMQQSLTMAANSSSGNNKKTHGPRGLSGPTYHSLTAYLPNRYTATRGISSATLTPKRSDAMVSQVRDTVLTRAASVEAGSDPYDHSSARSSPLAHQQPHNIIQLPSRGGQYSPHKFTGVWNPPPQASPSARLTHLQYNSPLDMYTAGNVADAVEKTSGGKIEWIGGKPQSSYLSDIKQSKTYQLIHEMENGPHNPPNGSGEGAGHSHHEQSRTIKTLYNTYHRDGIL